MALPLYYILIILFRDQTITFSGTSSSTDPNYDKKLTGGVSVVSRNIMFPVLNKMIPAVSPFLGTTVEIGNPHHPHYIILFNLIINFHVVGTEFYPGIKVYIDSEEVTNVTLVNKTCLIMVAPIRYSNQTGYAPPPPPLSCFFR